MRNTLELEKDKYRGDNIKGVKYLFKPKKQNQKKQAQMITQLRV